MRLFGRIIVYGEYLFSAGTRGLIMPARLSLATKDHAEQPFHVEYDSSRDSVARTLERRGLGVEKCFRGDLPFGWGLASSTVLAFLHAGGRLPEVNLLALVNESDQAVHGIMPSGVDSTSVLHQSTGFYSTRGWEPVEIPSIPYSLLLFAKERALTLSWIKDRIYEDPSELVEIADKLTAKVSNTGEMDYELLLDYSWALLERRLYSRPVEAFIRKMLVRGVVAKGTGGLYDKAVLVVWPDAVDRVGMQNVIDSSAPVRIFDSLT